MEYWVYENWTAESEAVILPTPTDGAPSVVAMRTDPEVEAIAVEVTKKYEREQGRKPASVDEENCDCDITSLAGGQVARYIEVKGRAEDGAVALTPNGWMKAQRFGEAYWLYVVTDCRSEPRFHMIRDRATKLQPKEEVSVVRYVVGHQDWDGAAQAVEAGE